MPLALYFVALPCLSVSVRTTNATPLPSYCVTLYKSLSLSGSPFAKWRRDIGRKDDPRRPLPALECVIRQAMLLPLTCVLYQQTPQARRAKPTVVWLLIQEREEGRVALCGSALCVCVRCIHILQRRGGVQQAQGVQADSWQHLGHIRLADVFCSSCQQFCFRF